MAADMSAAGAAIGSAVMPGLGTAIGGVLGSFMGGSGKGGGSGFAPQDAHSAIYGDLGLDGSGWNVNFSGVQTNGSNKAGQVPVAESLGLSPGSMSPILLVGGLVIFGLLLWKKSS